MLPRAGRAYGRDMATTSPSTLADFRGVMIEPGDAGYELARRVYNAMIDRRPALVAQAAGADDVARLLAYARQRDLPVAIRGGGHNGAGLGTVDDGLVIDLSAIRGIDVDPRARTVRVGGGCTWGEVDRATHEHGLATPSGIISTTGVGGLTLGGGLGHLTRKHGLAIDNLVGADVVLASGELVHASEDEHPDLFWALRGGGGNFGVVTAFEFRLHEVDTVIAGPTFWPIECGGTVLAAYREFLPAAPRELNGFFAFATVPPAPPFPEPLHMRKVCGVVWCHTGGEAAAARDMQPLLRRAPGAADARRPADAAPRAPERVRRALPQGRPVVLARRLRPRPPGRGGRPARASTARRCRPGSRRCTCTRSTARRTTSAPSETAFAYRDANYGAVFAGVDPDPANVEAIGAWSRGYQEALHPYSAGGAYVNMMMDEGPDRVRASYRGNYERLAQIKAEYDPENLLRINQNIPPAR